MQRELAEMMPPGRYPQDREGRGVGPLHGHNTRGRRAAAAHQLEVVEEGGAVPPRPTPREELIDVWHFVIQAAMELGMTPDDILQEYAKKNAVNKERQLTGY